MNRLLLLFFLSISFSGVAQHQDKVDFIRGEISIEPIPLEKKIKGSVTYEFDILQDVDSVFLDAQNMEFERIILNGKRTKYIYDEKTLSIKKKFKKGDRNTLVIDYSCQPEQTAYFLGWDEDVLENEQTVPAGRQVWTQGQGKYTSHWLPSIDDMEEKVEFDMSIVADSNYQVVSNGKLIEEAQKSNDKRHWAFDMQKPMSSYLLAFAIGNYEKQELKSASGIPIENFYYPQDSLKVEPTYRYTKEIFDFLENEIGVPYPWQNYKQIPVHDFLYAGMENTSATIFSDQYVIDSIAFVDKNYVNVNAHELAHQWFGNLVTEKNANHHWLHEGFATYFAYLAEKEIFGDDHFHWKLYETLQQLQQQFEKGEGQSLLDAKSSSLTFYEKGAWALFMLRNEVGDRAFKKGIKNYLKNFQFKNATVDDFVEEMEKASEKNLANFRAVWLEAKNIPLEEAKKLLADRSSSIKLLLEMEAELVVAQSDDIDYQKFWNATNSIHLKKYLLKNYEMTMLFDGMRKAFESDTIPIRQAMLDGAPFDSFLPKEYLLTLLKDDSYITKEMALFQLWKGYPEDRIKYLEKTDNVMGLPNKNVRLMWLTLAMVTEGFESLKTKEYFDELSGYTNPEYSFEIRQGAFFYLNEAFGFNDESLRNLVLATGHHSWQFRKYARDLLDGLLNDVDYKPRLEKLSKELNSEKIRYLINKLSE